MRRPVGEQVVVLTGASSGIGCCAARHLAARGARVVLTARSADALEEIAAGIRSEGGEALAVPGDVTSAADLEEVAQRALRRYGRIDTWVNNAAVYAQGLVQDFSLAEYRRVLDVNLVGTINGTLRALEAMLPRGRGIIVQVSSIIALRGAPFAGPYAAAKQGIDGFTQAARSELLGTGVRIATLYLPGVDTPIYQHALARLGTMPKPPPFVVDPVRAARAIADLAETGRRRRHVGVFHWLYSAPGWLSPAIADRFLHLTARLSRSSRRPGKDNLWRPTGLPARVRGGWSGARGPRFWLGALALGLGWSLWRRRAR